MKLSRIKELVQGEFLWDCSGSDVEIVYCIGSDMMSDVLAHPMPGALLITGLTNSQSVRTAKIADSAAILYVRGKRPDQQTIELAEEFSMPLIGTKMGMFETCGILYAAGLEGVC